LGEYATAKPARLFFHPVVIHVTEFALGMAAEFKGAAQVYIKVMKPSTEINRYSIKVAGHKPRMSVNATAFST
jgi:hypothetical protein